MTIREYLNIQWVASFKEVVRSCAYDRWSGIAPEPPLAQLKRVHRQQIRCRVVWSKPSEVRAALHAVKLLHERVKWDFFDAPPPTLGLL